MNDDSLRDPHVTKPQGIKSLLIPYYQELTGHGMPIHNTRHANSQ